MTINFSSEFKLFSDLCNITMHAGATSRAIKRMASVFLFVLLLGLVLGMFLSVQSLQAAGRIHYVAPDGTDSTACTASQPCLTIQQAITNAMTGDEIRVAAGTYAQVNTLDTYTQVVYLDKSLTLAGGFTTTNWMTADPVNNVTILDAGGLGRVIYVPDAVVATVRGFHLRNGATDAAITKDGPGVYNESGTLTLEHNWIYANTTTDGWGGGVANGYSGVAATLYLRNNEIYANSSQLGGGFSLISGTASLEANRIYENSATVAGGGVHVGDGNLFVRNNLLYENTAGGGGGIAVGAGSAEVQNTTLYANSDGIYADGGQTSIENTVILSNTGAAITEGISPVLFVDYTDFFGNGSLGIDPALYGDGNQTSRNPKLVDPESGDFHLESDSPLIDDGVNLEDITADFEGEGRPFGSSMDRGADEYTSAGPCYARLSSGRVYTSVQAAVDASTYTTDVVKVAGTCSGVTSHNGVSQTVYLDKQLTLRGGYTVTDWLSPSSASPSVLDAEGLGRVFYMTNTSAVTVENLHLTRGQADKGGAVFVGSEVTATLQNTVLYASSASQDGGALYNAGGNVLLQHNTFYNNTATRGGAVAADDQSQTLVTLYNNIVANNTGDGFYQGAAGQFSLDYNNVYGNTGSNYGNISAGPHDISVVPLFEDAAGGDFHLGLTSALVNAADPASSVSEDFEGDPRPARSGSRADIGADERLIYAEPSLSEETPYTTNDLTEIEGKVITFTHTLTNVGNTLTHFDSFAIALSNSQGWPITLTDVITPVELGRDESVSFSVLVKVPDSLPGETLYNSTLVTATSETSAAAFDAVMDIIAKPGADFTPDYTENVDPGDVVTYTHTLTNRSGGPDTFTFSADSPFGWGEIITPTGAVTLQHDESTAVVVRVAVAANAMAGLEDVMQITAESQGFGFSVMVTDATTSNPVSGDRYVSLSGDDTNNNCTQSDDPCVTISYAVNQAAWGDHVRIAGGTYYASGIFINQNVSLRGGYEPGNWSSFNPTAFPTVIDAQGNDRVLRVQLSAAVKPTIEYLTLKNGESSGVGGGIYLQSSSSPTLSNLTIMDSAASHGGAIYVASGSPIFLDLTISDTAASLINGKGGAIYVDDGAPVIEDVTISGSEAYSGGGIYNTAGDVRIYRATIVDAVAEAQGGAVYLQGGTLAISQTHLSSNTADAGGAVYNASGALTLVNTFVYSNTAATGGGGVANAGALTALNNTLYANHAGTQGGAFLNTGADTSVISNTIVVSNTAAAGGGIYHTGSGSASLDYNDVWGNVAASDPDSNIATGPHSISVDPQFVDVGALDLHLTFESPCVDAADPNTQLTSDVDGDIRPVNQGFDMGADEVAGCLARNSRTGEVFGVIQDAIDAAEPSDEIQVAGMCRGVQSRLVGDQVLSQTVLISKPLSLVGGYNSNFNSDPLATTILDARGLGRVIVVTGTDSPDVPVVLSKLTLLNGAATDLGGGPSGVDAGGTFYNHDDIVVMQGCVISESHAAVGGGFYNAGGQLSLKTIDDIPTQVMSNTATLSGGGGYFAGGAVTLNGVVFTRNDAFQGGAFYQDASTTLVSQSSFYSNTASLGGAVFHDGVGALDLDRSTFMGNAAESGGALFNNTATSTLSLANSLVVSNTATTGNGGGFYNSSQGSRVRHVTFYGNIAGDRGGGLYDGATVAGAAVVNSSLFVDNVAGSSGNAIYSASADPAFDYNDVYPSAGYGGTLLEGDGTGNISADPLFESLDPSDGNFLHLMSTSPVKDIADPASPITVDFDGEPRPSDGGFDMGADELGGCYIRINGEGPVYGNVQVAINNGVSGDVLHIAGTCRGTDTFVDAGETVSQTAFLTKSLTLQGGYSFDLDEWEVADPIEYPTTLRAMGLGRVVYVTNTAVITLDGLRLRDGYGDLGGAIFVGDGDLNVKRSHIYSSTATYGGALYAQGGTITFLLGDVVTNTNILYNNNAAEGGALYNAGGNLVLDGALVRYNEATADGGAFYHAGGDSVVKNTVLRENAAANGGAIYNAASSGLTVWHNVFYKNDAVNGGGLYTVAPTTVANNIFFDENPTASGYAVYSTQAFSPDYNDAYANSGTAYGGSATAGPHSLSVDPLFEGGASGDFHLQATSPVIDKGDPTMSLLYDFEGDVRPGDQGFDMGVDEIPSCLAQIVRTGTIYGNVQAAIDDSLPDDEIWVTSDYPCRGVHSFDGMEQTVHIPYNLTLKGGYTVDDVGDFVPSGSFTSTVLDAGGLGRVMLITDTSAVTVSNFILQNGDATGQGGGPSGADAGGLLYYHGSGASLLDMGFYAGSAAYGGGIFNAGSDLSLRESQVATSTATIAGGGIYNVSDAMILVGNEIFGNTASDGSATGQGGGLYNESGTLSMASNLIHHNVAYKDGGGFYNADSPSVLDVGNQFYDNEASVGDGGAICSADGNIELYNTLVYRNLAYDEGMGVYIGGTGAVATLYHNTFYGNRGQQATSRGGAVFVASDTSAFIKNNIFDANQAGLSGGGGAVYAPGTVTLDYNAYYENSGGDVVAGDAAQGPNAFDGVQPLFVNEANDNFHLSSTSPLIDHAADTSVTKDFDGDPRPINAKADIGADEYRACMAKVASSGEIYGSIQQAFENSDPGASANGDLIQVTGICEESLTLNHKVTIEGGYNEDFSKQNTGSPAIIDAQGSSRVVTASGDYVVLSSVALINGDTTGDGGGLLSSADTFKLDKVWITDCASDGSGGGLYVSNGTVDLVDLAVTDNYAAGDGGGIYLSENITATLESVLIDGNQAMGSGGALYNAANTYVDISMGGMTNNTAGVHGGALYNAPGSEIDISGGSRISLNSAAVGGGVYNDAATFILAQKQVNENTATAGSGGGIYADGASVLELTNLGLYGNSATVDGGGLYKSGSVPASIYHATINGNTADGQGDGIYNIGSNMVVSATILAYNGTPAVGDAVYADGGNTVTLDHSLVWENTLVGSVTAGNLITADPQLRNRFTGSGDLDYTSPAIDAVPTADSHVLWDRVADPRPLLCAKDIGRDEYKVGERLMTWTINPSPVGATVIPGDVVTYVFGLTNQSTWQNTVDNGGVPGTGYTETLRLSLASTLDYAQFVSTSSGGVILSGAKTITAAIGPGDTFTMSVQVTVPDGATASLEEDDTTKEFTSISYEIWGQCADYEGAVLDLFPSNTIETRVAEFVDFEIAPPQSGVASPGQSITYTHVITNMGNVTDTYTIYPQAGFYAIGDVITPASGQLLSMGPGMTDTVVLRVTVNEEAAKGLTDRTSVIARSSVDGSQTAAMNSTVISSTSGTRYVAVNGTDSFVDETDGNPDPEAVNYADNNCTQPAVGSCRTIQQAIAQAEPGEEIRIAGGVYSDTVVVEGTPSVTQTAYISKSLVVRGGYEIADWEADPPNHISHTTTLAPSSGRALYVADGVTVTLDRLDLSGGDATGFGGGPSAQDAGGNLYNAGADLTLYAVRIRDGVADMGAGLYAADGDLLVQNSLLHGNQALSDGGALYAVTGTVMLQNNTVYTNVSGQAGCGVYVDQGALAVTNTIFSDNTGGSGGAVQVGSATASYDYNLSHANVPADTSNVTPGPNSIVGDPRFAAPVAEPPVLSLLAGSPAQDVGAPDTALTSDYADQPRPQGLGFDMGAYERVPFYDLLFYSDVTTNTLTGQTLVLTHTLENLGDTTDNFVMTATQTAPWTVVFEESLPYTITLGAGATHVVPVTITVPVDASGRMTVVMTATSASAPDLSAWVLDTVIVKSAAWEIGKAVEPADAVQPGDYLTYTLTMTNTGELAAGGVYTITDALPANTSFVSASDSPVLTSPTVTWVASDPVAVGSSITRSLVVQVTQPLMDGVEIGNTVYGVEGGGAPALASGAPVSVTVDAPSDLRITKAAVLSAAVPGDYLTYTLTITNPASALGPALGVVISDTLPDEFDYRAMNFVAPSTGVTQVTGNELRWLVDVIPVGDVVQVTASGRVTSPLASDVLLTNIYRVSADNDAGQQAQLLTPVTVNNVITLTKTAEPALVAAGETVTYTVVLTNTGNGIADVSLTDVLSTGFVPASYLTSVAVPGSTWTEPGTATVIFTAAAPSVAGVYANPVVTATYDLKDVAIHDTAPVTVFVPDTPISGLNAVSDSPTALGSATTFTATVAEGTNVVYEWAFGDGDTGSGTVASHTYPAVGTYTAVVTASNNVSVFTTTTAVLVEEAVGGLTAENDSPTVLNNATTLTATITQGSNVTYEWAFGDGNSGSGAVVTHTYPVGTYTAVVTASNAVSVFTATTTVSVGDEILSLTAENDSPTPLNSATTLTATTVGGTDVVYEWDFGDGDTGGGAVPTHIYLAVGSYTAVVTASNAVSVFTATTEVVVEEAIASLTAENDSPTVLNNATTLTATITQGSNVIYAWDFGDGAVGSGAVLTHTYSVGTYTAVVTASNAVGVFTATTTVTVDEAILGLAAENDGPTVLGNATMLTATVTQGSNVTYEWDFGDGDTSSGAATAHTYAVVGSYTAVVTATNSVGVFTATTTVIVEESIAGLAAENDGPTALGSATTFTATLTQGSNVTYAWDFGDGAVGSGDVTAHTYATVGSYTAVVTATNPVGVFTATTTVVVEEAIDGLAAVNDSPTAWGDPTTLTATVTQGSNVTYEWDLGDGTTGSGAVVTYTYPAVGTYTTVVTASNAVGVFTATTTVTITDVPIAGLAAENDSPTPLGSATALTATVADGSSVSYTWAFGDGAVGSGAATAHVYPAVGTYTAVVTASNPLGVFTTTTTVTITDVPIAGLLAENDGPTALGTATTLTATLTQGSNVTYMWDFGDGNTDVGASVSHMYATVGMYMAVVTASNGVSVVTATTTVVVDETIAGLNAVDDSPTVLGNATALTATVTGGSNVTYAWNFGDGATGSGAAVTHIYPDVGTYSAVVTATNSVGTAVATTTVTVIDVPVSGLTAENDSPTPLGSATALTASVAGGSHVVYEWDFGDGNSGTGVTPSHIYPAVGTYTAVVTASNTNNLLVATTQVTITDAPVAGVLAYSDSPTAVGYETTLVVSITEGSNVTYEWDFGDGTPVVSGSLSSGTPLPLTHTYSALGSYTAVVTVSNSVSVFTRTTVVEVVDVVPISGLAAVNDGPTALGSATTLTATVTAGSDITYVWDFGDGNVGSGPIVTHTYPAVGTYTAVVTASNLVDTVTTTINVTVIPPTYRVYIPLLMRAYRTVPGPDLRVTALEVTQLESTYLVSVTVENRGTEAVAYGNNFYVDFYVDQVPETLVRGDYYWGAQGAWFGVGESHTFTATYALTSGSHQLYAQVDTDKTVVEGNEGNNVYGPQPFTASGVFSTGSVITPAATPLPSDLRVPRATPTPMP